MSCHCCWMAGERTVQIGDVRDEHAFRGADVMVESRNLRFVHDRAHSDSSQLINRTHAHVW